MELKFKDGWGIVTDENNFTLNRLVTKGEKSEDAGGTYLTTSGYYGTLQMALKGYLKHSLRKNSEDVNTVEGLLKRLDELEANILNVKIDKTDKKEKGK